MLSNNDTLRAKVLEKKQYSKALLSIDSGRLTVFDVKKKDEIDISNCELSIEPKQGLSENNKYQFTLSFKKRGLLGIQRTSKLTLGSDSESARKDWMFMIELT